MLVMCTLLHYYCLLLLISTIFIFACYCMLLQNLLLQCYYIFLHCYYLLLHLSLLPIITNSLLLIITYYYVIITSLLPHYAILKIHVIMDSLLHIITLACFIIMWCGLGCRSLNSPWFE